jgi:hypothetical protein
MDTLKEVLSFAAAVIGLLTVLIPILAKVIDKKKRAEREADAERPRPPRPRPSAEPVLVALPVDELEESRPPAGPRAVQQASALVQAPAVLLISFGFLGLFFNLFVAGFGYVDEFVTPLTEESKARAQAREAGRPGKEASERTSAVLAVVALLSFAAASGMAIWAGFNMIRLRSYWLSVAGSVAVMPGACLCCFAGLPIGSWCLFVLLKPEVSSSFT